MADDEPQDVETLQKLLREARLGINQAQQETARERREKEQALQRQQEIAARAEQERREKEQERREKEQALGKAQKLQEDGGFAAFLDRGLRPLKRTHGSTTPSVQKSSAHLPAVLEQGSFGDLDPQELREGKGEVQDSLKIHADLDGFLPFSNESTIGAYIGQILAEASLWAGLKKDLLIESQYYLSADRPDFVLIVGREFGIPVGVVEVKLPDRQGGATKAMEAGMLHGQLLNYLLTLRHLYGVEHPFGIATTYLHWRVCWLPDSDAVAAAQPSPPPALLAPTQNPLPRPGPFSLDLVPSLPGKTGTDAGGGEGDEHGAGDDGSKEGEGEGDPAGAGEGEQAPGKGSKKGKQRRRKEEDPNLPGGGVARILHGTPLMHFEDRALPLRIVSVLSKMAAATFIPRQVQVGKVYPLVTRNYLTWKRLPVLPADPPSFPHGNTRNFYLLHELGHGLEGRVYHACSATGDTCAIKVYKAVPRRPLRQDEDEDEEDEEEDEEEDSNASEVKIWKKVWRLPAYSATFLGRRALVMPLVLTMDLAQDEKRGEVIPAALSAAPALLDATREALRRLDAEGYRHDDLHWRHVGFYRDAEGIVKAVLIDCKMTEKTPTSLSEMLARLCLT